MQLKEIYEGASSLFKLLDLVSKFKGSEHSKRLNKVLNESVFSIPQIAEYLQFSSCKEFEKLIKAESDITFDFINFFSEKFGVNKNWFLDGRDTPYKSYLLGSLFASDMLDLILEYSPKEILFVRDDSINHRGMILFKFSDFKTIYIDQYWHISSQVGDTGMKQLRSLYILYRILEKTSIQLSEYKINQLTFDQIYTGEINSSNVEFGPYSFWLQDLCFLEKSLMNYSKVHDEELFWARNYLKNYYSGNILSYKNDDLYSQDIAEKFIHQFSK